MNPKYYAGFDWTSCLGLASGDSCQPTCRSSVSVVAATGSPFTLGCDSNGYIGYRSTDGNAAGLWQQGNGANSVNSYHNAYTHLSTFGFWINFGDYPYNHFTHGGMMTSSSLPGPLQCYLPVCDATSTTVTNNLVANAGAGVDYTDCERSGATTGDICTPTCSTGYAKTYSDGAASAKIIYLQCDANTGGFDGTTNVQCTPNVCSAAAVQCSSSACANNRVWTSCDGLPSGATCTPTCAPGFTGNAVATGFKLACADSTGAFNGDLEPSLTSCTENKCAKALASTKTGGIDYSECEFTGSTTSQWFTTGRMCAPHCDQSLGYASNILPDVVATLHSAGTGYHVDDLVTVAATFPGPATATYFDVPNIIMKVATLGSSTTNAQGRPEGPIGTVIVLTPAYPYRAVPPGGSADAETFVGSVFSSTVLNGGGAGYASTTSDSTSYMSKGTGAKFSFLVRRVIIVNGGSGWNDGDTFTISDSQLGGGGAPDYVVSVKTSGNVIVGYKLNDQNAINVINNGALRKPGYYTNLTPTAKSNSGAAYPTVSIIVPQMKKLSCNTAAASPTTNAFPTFDFDGSINSGMTCAATRCDKTPKAGSTTEEIDWSSCLNKVSGQTCTPVCKGGYATTQTGAVLTLKCPNGWIDVTGWATPTTCASGLCSTSAITNAIPGVDYASCNGLNTGQACQPSCPSGSATSVAGSAITVSCNVDGSFSASQTTPTACSLYRCTNTVPTSPQTGADYSNCINRYTGDTCVPTCAAGFGTPTGASSFTLSCSSAGAWNAAAGSTACTATACTNGATTSSAKTGVDYTACKAQNSGGICAYACNGGNAHYTLDASSTGSSFALTCTASVLTFTDPASTSPCVGNSCSAGCGSGCTTNADYSSCTSLSSGGVCTPGCNAGYRLAANKVGFEVQCTSSNQFVVPSTHQGYPICQANVCSGTVTGNIGLDYSSCQYTTSGYTCTPTCPAGYACGGSITPISSLVCSENGAFTDSGNSGVTVTAERCKVVNPSSAVANVDYRHCTISTSYSGSYCTPTCVSGYSTTTAATTFKQVCAATTGYFDGTNTIVCKVLAGQTCAGLGWTNVVNGVCGETDSKLGPGQTEVLYLSKTYAQAYEICNVAGVRLCTQAEIDQGSAKNTGSLASQASLGNLNVWTSTACNGATSHVVAHNQATGSFVCALDTTASYAVQCCTWQTAPAVAATPAPPPPPPPPPASPSQSSSTCAALGWSKIVNGVCAESDQGFNSGTNACYTTTRAGASSVCTAIGARLCTGAEINSGVSTGTGCNFDLSYVWTSGTCTIRARSSQRSVGYVSAKGDGSGFTECLTAADNRPVRCCADVTIASSSRRTCSTLGWARVVSDVCGESDTGLGGCNSGKTYTQAATICAAAGARLCNVAEVDSGATKSTGCNFDTKWVWTSDSCGTGMYWVSRGSGTGERKCKPASKTKNVRCCSDISLSTTKAPAVAPAPPAAPPRVSCAGLGWTRIISNVCGESDAAPFRKCFNFRSQPSASDVCAGMGARLCTATEIASAVTATTGCNFDNKYVWTSTPCSGGYLTALGSGSGGLTSCIAASVQAPVRCCSDVAV